MGREALAAGAYGDIDKMNRHLEAMESASVQVANAIGRLIEEITSAQPYNKRLC